MNEKQLIQFLRSGQSVNLSGTAKAAGRARLLTVMRECPLPSVGLRWGFFENIAKVFSTHRLAYGGLMATLVLLLGSGSISFAAERALPGDPLYKMKRSVNERVLEALATSPQAQVEWEVKRMGRRIQEADQLVLQGRLDAERVAELEENATEYSGRFDVLIQNLEADHQEDRARQAEEDFRNILESGKRVNVEVSDHRVMISEKSGGRNDGDTSGQSGLENDNSNSGRESSGSDDSSLSQQSGKNETDSQGGESDTTARSKEAQQETHNSGNNKSSSSKNSNGSLSSQTGSSHSSGDGSRSNGGKSDAHQSDSKESDSSSSSQQKEVSHSTPDDTEKH